MGILFDNPEVADNESFQHVVSASGLKGSVEIRLAFALRHVNRSQHLSDCARL